ncbi:MAG: hypothetical protein EOM90_11610 [Alphaproteobacteria bacterium]|nr:hypothetical protein [Alphaproteobacteria bacterium]
MKKILFFAMLMCTFSMSALTQTAYFRVGLGAAIGTANSLNNSHDGLGNNDQVTVKTGGYGTGMPFVLAGGINLGDHFGIELGVDYFMGFASKWYDKSNSSTFDYKTKGSMLSLVPAFVTRFDLYGIKPYARFGIMIGIMNSVVTSAEGTSNPESRASGVPITYKIKDNGGVALGVQAALGAELELSNSLSLFGEFQLYGISYAPKKGAYKEYTVGGVDQLDDMKTRSKEWKYLKEVDYNKTISADDPDERPKTKYNFNNVGLVVGVKINLGK